MLGYRLFSDSTMIAMAALARQTLCPSWATEFPHRSHCAGSFPLSTYFFPTWNFACLNANETLCSLNAVYEFFLYVCCASNISISIFFYTLLPVFGFSRFISFPPPLISAALGLSCTDPVQQHTVCCCSRW